MRFATILLVSLAACGDDPINCDDGLCDCSGGEDCAFDCEGDGCDGVCENVSNCDGLCGDGCELDCLDTSNCAFACGDDCDVLCERVSNCQIACEDTCAVTCRDVSNCEVEILGDAVVVCESVGNCDVTCRDGGSALDCGADLFTCLDGCPE